jgi:hypothetical protein
MSPRINWIDFSPPIVRIILNRRRIYTKTGSIMPVEKARGDGEQ